MDAVVISGPQWGKAVCDYARDKRIRPKVVVSYHRREAGVCFQRLHARMNGRQHEWDVQKRYDL